MNRRGFITGLISFVAAPAIVRPTSLMKIKPIRPDIIWRASWETETLEMEDLADIIYNITPTQTPFLLCGVNNLKLIKEFT